MTMPVEEIWRAESVSTQAVMRFSCSNEGRRRHVLPVQCCKSSAPRDRSQLCKNMCLFLLKLVWNVQQFPQQCATSVQPTGAVDVLLRRLNGYLRGQHCEHAGAVIIDLRLS